MKYQFGFVMQICLQRSGNPVGLPVYAVRRVTQRGGFSAKTDTGYSTTVSLEEATLFASQGEAASAQAEPEPYLTKLGDLYTYVVPVAVQRIVTVTNEGEPYAE